MILDKLNLGRRHTACDQLGLEILIDREPAAFGLRGRKVAEDHLREPLVAGLLPDGEDFPDGLVDLAVRMVRRTAAHEPQVERCFAALARDLEHVVVARIDFGRFELFGALRQRGDERLEFRRGRRPDNAGFAAVERGHRQLEHVRGLHVRHLAEQVHEFRHVHEAGEPGVEPVAGAVRGEFHRRHGLAKGPGPRVEVLKPLPAEHVHLQVTLHRKHFRHRIRHGSPRREDDASAAVLPLDVLHLEQHVERAL